MKPHPRIRKTVKWGGAAVTVLLLALWIGSGLGYVWWIGRHGLCGVGSGQVRVKTWSFEMMRQMHGWRTGRHDPYYLSFFGAVDEYRGDWDIRLPLWPLCAVSSAAVAIAWRLDILASRRARANLCPNCHYNLTGLAPGAVCPECGEASVPS